MAERESGSRVPELPGSPELLSFADRCVLKPDAALADRRPVRDRYESLIGTGSLQSDEAQLSVADRLDRLIVDISTHRLARKSSALGWLFARRRSGEVPIKGLYIQGAVGRGKTMLMDLFFELVPVQRKRRAHFNDFMADVHERIAIHRNERKRGLVKEDDPIPPVAASLAEQSWVLCFDEFSVNDIADAMILSRLFSALFQKGVVLVATSNLSPDDLYRDGLNRQLFLPFITILEKHVDTVTLDARTDYRREKKARLPVYLSPLDTRSRMMMDEIWEMTIDGEAESSDELVVKGRKVPVTRCAAGAARFCFPELCTRPLGARDYGAIAENYHTVLIENVPVMDKHRRNEAKRFILLVDTLYDRQIRLVISAESGPDQLYLDKNGTEGFEFKRTASRLFEMQSAQYLGNLVQ